MYVCAYQHILWEQKNLGEFHSLWIELLFQLHLQRPWNIGNFTRNVFLKKERNRLQQARIKKLKKHSFRISASLSSAYHSIDSVPMQIPHIYQAQSIFFPIYGAKTKSNPSNYYIILKKFISLGVKVLHFPLGKFFLVKCPIETRSKAITL